LGSWQSGAGGLAAVDSTFVMRVGREGNMGVKR
jgi:hypothetical protein